jgi:hypothetical protein
MAARKNDDAWLKPCSAWRAGTMSDDKLYDIPAEWKQRAYVKEADYQALYERSIKDPNAF